MSAITVGEALQEAGERVEARDARVLLCHATGRSPAYLAAHPEGVLSDNQLTLFDELIDRRSDGEPVAYLVGEREFYGRPFKVGPAVLIPRPETELLVDLALERIPKGMSARVLDLGTGSGCIAIAIASERSQSKILALDQSLEALAVARRNAADLRIGNVAFLRSDWFQALGNEHFDVIVCNPPYVAAGDPHLEALRFEPKAALEAGEDGLDAIRQVVTESRQHLLTGGWLLLEHGHDQAERTRALMQAAGYEQIFSARDLAGIERVIGGRLTR